MQSFSSAIIDGPGLDDMGQKEISAQLEKLTGRVTALEKKLNSITKSATKGKWGVDRLIALGILVFTVVGIPIMLASWIEPHLHNDLKNDLEIEVTNQLKEPLKQIGEIAGDVKEIKGKLEVLDPLIRELATKRISEAGTMNSKDLVSRLPELRHLATIAKTANIALKPEIVEKVGKKLVEAGAGGGAVGADAWNTALDFLNYKSFLNASLSIAVNTVQGTGTLYTVYNPKSPPGTLTPRFGVAGAVPKEQAAQLVEIGEPDPNRSLPLGNDWIIATGGNLTIDRMHMKKVILRNVNIFYDGGPLEMQDVYFINCTFEVRQQANGERLVAAVLQPSPAVNFTAS